MTSSTCLFCLTNSPNPSKIFHLQWCKLEKRSKSSHLRIFANCFSANAFCNSCHYSSHIISCILWAVWGSTLLKENVDQSSCWDTNDFHLCWCWTAVPTPHPFLLSSLVSPQTDPPSLHKYRSAFMWQIYCIQTSRGALSIAVWVPFGIHYLPLSFWIRQPPPKHFWK